MSQNVFDAARSELDKFLYIVRAVFYVTALNGTRVSFFKQFHNGKTGRTSLIHV
ncbi:RAxF-45 family protein [Alteribacter natronophilus]|uniref:RAxF-45 family protein n=1 Tax=Alteribacter natronophilus TaxID=2583810 RepID=UPI0014870084|nr:RAxF-45 family protein [Alteribacter natronophilus]